MIPSGRLLVLEALTGTRASAEAHAAQRARDAAAAAAERRRRRAREGEAEDEEEEGDDRVPFQQRSRTPRRRAATAPPPSLPRPHLSPSPVESDGAFVARVAPPGACAVCLEDMRVGDSCRALPCCHIFHNACVSQWIRNSKVCPTCRAPASAPQHPHAAMPGAEPGAEPEPEHAGRAIMRMQREPTFLLNGRFFRLRN